MRKANPAVQRSVPGGGGQPGSPAIHASLRPDRSLTFEHSARHRVHDNR
jgi:hypothetical protein